MSELASFCADLFCDGNLVQSVGGELVLGSPFRALHHLVSLLADDPHNSLLVAGEIVSTGTLKLAMPVSAGQTWTTRVCAIPFDGISLRFEAQVCDCNLVRPRRPFRRGRASSCGVKPMLSDTGRRMSWTAEPG